MRPRFSVRQRIKTALLLLISRSPRIRWSLAGLTGRRAFQAVCATQNEKELDELGRTDSQRIVPFLNVSSRVLDVGCGVGRVEKFLWPYCRSIDAIDVSDKMISIARTRLGSVSNVQFTRANATNLHMFRNQDFDVCFSFHCLQHMQKEDAWLALTEVFRVLKLGGLAYLHFPSFMSATYFSLFTEKKHWADKSRVRAYTMPELERIVTSIGYDIVGHEEACLNPFVDPLEPKRDILITLRKQIDNGS